MDENNIKNTQNEPVVEPQDTEEEAIDDIVPETDTDTGAPADFKAKLDKLKAKLKESEAKKQEYLDGWQRARADFVNLRKRDEEEKKEFVKFASERLIDEIIPVLDSFEMAMGNKEAWEKADKNWRLGVEYIYSQLKAVLERQGLSEINPIGLTFDVNRDEASEYVPVEKESENNIVVTVMQKGYTLNGKFIRPAKVKVGEYKGKV